MYTYTHNKDCFRWDNGTYETKEEVERIALQEAKENGYNIMYIGTCQEYPLPTIDVENLLYDLNEQYGEEISEYDGDLYDGVVNTDILKLEEELNKVLKEFHIEKNIKSNWFEVVEIYEIMCEVE